MGRVTGKRTSATTKRTGIEELIGIARYSGPRRTLREMDEGVLRGVRDMWTREQRMRKRKRAE